MTVEEYNISVDNYSDGIYRFILRNIKNKDTARDIVQDSYEKLWRKLSQVNYEKVKSYLFTTAYHTMIDYIRKERKTQDIDNTDINLLFHSRQYTDVQEVLHEALDKLPEIQRSVILLRDYEGYSYQEIGEITGLNESQVKVYIYRGRIFLKSYIGKLEYIL
ncbi:MAG: RNA polymerase sigma factor [Spirochaetes bacterium]|nr:RNA polymerase sigma factor [Spirochaetota bacterium]